MKKQILMGTLVVAFMAAFTSCKKKEGCTDKDATNYDSEAKKDNNTCTFKGKVVFWTSTADSLTYAEMIEVKINGTAIGSVGYGVAAEPTDCASNGYYNAVYEDKPGTYSYTAKQTLGGTKTWSGSVTITSKGCMKQQIKK